MKTHFLSVLLLAGCTGQGPQDPQKRTKPSFHPVQQVEMAPPALPEGLLPTKSLDDEAEMQYADTGRQFYFVVTEELASDINLALSDEIKTSHLPTLERYAILRQQALKMDHPDYKPGKIIETKSGNNNLATFSFRDKIEGLDKPVFYQFSFVEGTRGIYTITGWCAEGKEVEFLKKYQEFTSRFTPL